MTKAIIGIYRHDPKANDGEGQSRLIKTIPLSVELHELIRRSGWKGSVEDSVFEAMGDGHTILSVSIAKDAADMNANIIVTVDMKPPLFGQKRKATTRGGKPIGSVPVKTGKTMAGKSRSNGR